MSSKRQPTIHMGNQQKQNWLPKGQIGKTVSVEHCIKSRQAHSKSFVAFLYSTPSTPQPLLIFIHVIFIYYVCAPNLCKKENKSFLQAASIHLEYRRGNCTGMVDEFCNLSAVGYFVNGNSKDKVTVVIC